MIFRVRPALVIIDCATMEVSRYAGKHCTHRGFRIDIRPGDKFTADDIAGVIEDFRARPDSVALPPEPEAA